MEGYTVAYGHVIENGCKVDEAVLTVFPEAQKLYRRGYGGDILPRRRLFARAGAGGLSGGGGPSCRPGRVYPKGLFERKNGFNPGGGGGGAGLCGRGTGGPAGAVAEGDDALGRQARQIADRLVEMAGRIAAWLDYPEEDMEPVDSGWFMEETQKLLSRIEALLSGYAAGRLIRRGIDIAIVGGPMWGNPR
jgi:tRNA modification GTPase